MWARVLISIQIQISFYGRISIVAIWIALISVVGKYVILGVSGLLILTVDSNFLIIAPFVTCMVIFVFPFVCLEP